jgi:hypothetical protein
MKRVVLPLVTAAALNAGCDPAGVHINEDGGPTADAQIADDGALDAQTFDIGFDAEPSLDASIDTGGEDIPDMGPESVPGLEPLETILVNCQEVVDAINRAKTPDAVCQEFRDTPEIMFIAGIKKDGETTVCKEAVDTSQEQPRGRIECTVAKQNDDGETITKTCVASTEGIQTLGTADNGATFEQTYPLDLRAGQFLTISKTDLGATMTEAPFGRRAEPIAQNGETTAALGKPDLSQTVYPTDQTPEIELDLDDIRAVSSLHEDVVAAANQVLQIPITETPTCNADF